MEGAQVQHDIDRFFALGHKSFTVETAGKYYTIRPVSFKNLEDMLLPGENLPILPSPVYMILMLDKLGTCLSLARLSQNCIRRRRGS